MNTLDTIIKVIKKSLPSQVIFGPYESQRVYEKAPEPTTDFLKEKIIAKIKKI
jgi:hypothetical protein